MNRSEVSRLGVSGSEVSGLGASELGASELKESGLEVSRLGASESKESGSEDNRLEEKSRLGVIIVAGGSGTRMAEGDSKAKIIIETNIKKQFLTLCGTPVLMHSISKFYSLYPECQIVVVIAEQQQEYWRELCKQHKFRVPHKIADGGSTRFHSVQNALKIVDNVEFIAVHDGVRPLVSESVIREVVAAAEQHGAAVPVVMPVDSLREIAEIMPTTSKADTIKKSKPVDREMFRSVQTPQVFKADWLHKAYEQDYTSRFTDDASVAESAGYSVVLTQGDRNNIKITTKIDLYLAELICKNH